MTVLLDLPDELLSKVFRHLSAKEFISQISVTCKKFREIDQADNRLWKWFCWRDYKIGDEGLWNEWAFRDFYTKVLHKYGYLLGWWRRNLQYYGGLFLVKAEKNGIIGYECLPPADDYCAVELVDGGYAQMLPDSDYSPEAYHRLRFHKIFAIEPLATIVCYDGTAGQELRLHESQGSVQKTANGFKFVCPNSEEHHLDNNNWLMLDHGIQTGEDSLEIVMETLSNERCNLDEKFTAYKDARCTCEYLPLTIQRQIPNSVKYPCIKPGLYCSVYSAHGWEILNFAYSDDGTLLEGIKVRGDPNVPAGQISKRVFLTKPVPMTIDDQLTADNVKNAVKRAEENPNAMGEVGGDVPLLQPFRIPDDCSVEDKVVEKFRYSRWRFASEGQVAADGYTDASFTPSLFVVLNDDIFTVLWFMFDGYHTYCRVTNVDGM